MARDKQSPSIEIVRRYAATPAEVWKAWTSPEALMQWIGPGDGEQHDVGGEYREVQYGRRLVFSWAWKSAPEQESLVTVELRPIDTGTELVLTYERFIDTVTRDHHLQGWEGCLEKLAGYVAQ